LKNENETYIAKYPAIECDTLGNITETMVVQEYNSTVKKGYVECYCKDYILADIQNIQHEFGIGEKICLKWSAEKALQIAFPFLIVLSIVVINYIMQLVYAGQLRIFLISSLQ